MSVNGANGAQSAPSWILDLRKRLDCPAHARSDVAADRERIVFLLPLFVDQGSLWTVLGEDVASSEGELARVSFAAAACPSGEDPWPIGAQLATDVLGLGAGQALQIGSLPEQTVLGGLQVVPLVVAIPRPQMAGRTLSADTEAGVALFPFQLMSLLEPHRVSQRTVQLPEGQAEVDVAHIDDRQLWGPSLQVLEQIVAILAAAGS